MITSKSALLAIDLDTNLETADYEEVAKTICQVMKRWNVLKTYNSISANCQMFCEDLLECLGVDSHLKYTGCLGKILKDMKVKGKSQITFPVRKEAREALGIKESELSFKTHEEFDTFCGKLFAEFPEYLTDKIYREDYIVR